MNPVSRESAPAGSYPTFWNVPTTQPTAPPVAPDQAYSEFVSLCEEDFPSGEYRLDLPTAGQTRAD